MRFYFYVPNPVEIIPRSLYLTSGGTFRSPTTLPTCLRGTYSTWLKGPWFLRNASEIPTHGMEQDIISVDDPEVREELRTSRDQCYVIGVRQHENGEIQEILILVLNMARYCHPYSEGEVSLRKKHKRKPNTVYSLPTHVPRSDC